MPLLPYLTIFLLLIGVISPSSAQSLKPNIVFILVDDMGWQDTSVPFVFDQNGSPAPSPGNNIYVTPGMEKLANQGVRFTNAYAASVCSPSRTSIMTGLNCARTHVTNWTNPASPQDTSGKKIKEFSAPKWRIAGLNSSDPSMAKMFKSAGYRTIFVGKAHFGPTSNKAAQPEALGFDVNIGGCGAGQPGSYYGKDNYAEKATRFGQKLGPRDVPNLEKYKGTDTFLTDALADEMCKYIEDSVSKKKPFFAYFGHYAVHSPLMLDPQFADTYPNLNGHQKQYATLISGADKSILTLLDKLEQLGIAENTLIVFASDNGGTAPWPKPCAPLRDGKGTPYEGGIKTPLIVSWAKLNPKAPIQQKYPIQPGSRQEGIVALQDLFATFGSMIGAKIPAKLDSYDISGYFKKEKKVNRPETYFLNFPHEHTDAYYIAYREKDMKVIYHYLNSSWELYDLSQDIGETTNLAQQKPDVLAKMAVNLVAELKKYDSQRPIDNQTQKPALITMPDGTTR